MKFQPFAYWLFALILGIIIAEHYPIERIYLLIFGCISFLCISYVYINQRHAYIMTLFGFMMVTILGIWRYQQSNTFQASLVPHDQMLVSLKVDKTLKPSNKFNKYEAIVVSLDTHTNLLGQKVLLYVKKGAPILHHDDRFWIYDQFDSITSPKNPHVFDYKDYLAKKKIHLQIFTDTVVSVVHPHTITHQLSVFKQNTKSELRKAGFSPTSLVFIASLALGDRIELDSEFKETLSSAGVMHLFAISGLHVAIIFGFVMLLLYPVLYIPNGKILRWIVALIVIWIFAWFIEFSSSVLRAVFMISVYYITLILQRTSNIYHTLTFTAFVLLLIEPYELFQVGFQLSYSAVFFIAWLYQPIRRLLPLYRKPYKNYAFDLLSISTTAQFGVMPISVFYFNKFSLLFWIGNLFVLPFASLMVVTSLITVFVIHTGLLPEFWVNITNLAFEGIRSFLGYLTSYENFIIREITWSKVQVILLVCLLILTRRMLIRFKWHQLIPVLIVISLYQITRMWNIYQFDNKNEIIVFNQYKGTILGLRQGSHLDIFWEVEDSINTRKYIIQPYVRNERIDEVNYYPLYADLEYRKLSKKQNFLKFGQNLVVLTNGTSSSLPDADIIILSNASFKTSLEIPQKTKRIIADGSNYPSIINRLQKQSSRVYSTATEGAYLKSIE